MLQLTPTDSVSTSVLVSVVDLQILLTFRRILGRPVRTGDLGVLWDCQEEGGGRFIEAVSWPLAFGGWRTFFQEAELVDPVFERVFLAYRDPPTPAAQTFLPKGEEKVEEQRMRYHTFRDLPWAYLRLVFPKRTLAFKPLELLRLDLVTTVSLLALRFRWEFIETSADEVSHPLPPL